MKKLFVSPIIILLLSGLMVRIALSFFGTLTLDQNTFIAWSNILVNGGFRNFYNGWSDYLPGYLYALWVLGKVNTLNIIPTIVLYKTPAILADVATTYFIYRIVLKIKNEKIALATSALYLLNPAIIANSSLWGQIDGITAFFLVASLYFLERKWFLSAVFLAIGTAVKPQGALVAPVILYLMVRDRWNSRKLAGYLLIGFLVFIVLFIPFSSNPNIFQFIIQRITTTLEQYQFTSINAFNFWGITGFWRPDKTAYIVGYLAYFLTFIFSVYKFGEKKNSQYILTAISVGASYMFFTRMHERHLLPIFAPLAIAAGINPGLWISYLGLSGTYVANLYYSFRWISENFIKVFSDFWTKTFSLLNVVLLGLVIFPIKLLKSPKVEPFAFEPVKIKFPGFILAAILVFALVSRILFLGSPPKEYFDEVYHAFTAKVMLHNDPKAWEWWNTPPEGFAYEWTHPPLAKEMMVLGMLVFGENSFGYRIPAALFGTGIVFLVYLIAKELFKDEVLALISAAVLSLDGLVLVMSRIGMNDIYFLFFALLAIYLFLKDKYLFSSLALGLASASKWTVLWTIPVLGIIFLAQRKKIKIGLLWFLIIPPIIYLASYIPMFFYKDHTLQTFIDVQKQMWWYHTNLKATHSYSSPWYTWPFLIRPAWQYTSGQINNVVSNIYAMSNPVVSWIGVISITMSAFYAASERNRRLGIIIFSYLAYFVPWAASPRIMFMYHYLPSIPFLAIATGYILRRYPKFIIIYFVFGVLAFIYFYPHLTGIKIPVWLDNTYYWLDSWR
ncbi:MAG: glycosyltransferase family 39 protein [Patescibacteria group bacterium]